MSTFPAAHRASVCLLYRNILKHQLSWAVNRDVFNALALKTRELFRSNQDESSYARAEYLLQQGQQMLTAKSHPDLYTAPVNPGGSKYMRNTPQDVHLMKLPNVGAYATGPSHH